MDRQAMCDNERSQHIFAFVAPIPQLRRARSTQGKSKTGNKGLTGTRISNCKRVRMCAYEKSKDSKERPEAHGSYLDSGTERLVENELKSEVCTYCGNHGEVDCPVCHGRGYLGRTIKCYYCRGAEKIECPLCADDVYRFSYVAERDPPSSKDEPEPES